MGYQLPDQSGEQAAAVEGITDTVQGQTDTPPVVTVSSGASVGVVSGNDNGNNSYDGFTNGLGNTIPVLN